MTKIDFSTCTFEHIYFYNMEASLSQFDKTHYNIVKARPEVFQETLPGPLLVHKNNKVVEIKCKLPNARPIYKLMPKEEYTLRAQLVDALEKGLI